MKGSFAVEMRVSTSKSEAMLENSGGLLWVWSGLLPQAMGAKCLGILLTSEGEMEIKMFSADVVLGRCGEEGVEPEGKALDLPKE